MSGNGSKDSVSKSPRPDEKKGGRCIWLYNILSEPTYLLFKAIYALFFTSVGLFLFATVWHSYHSINTKVLQRFENPEPPSLIREGYHFARPDEENEVRKAFFNQTDTLGLVGVVFGPAGTGKSNVVRTVCVRVEKRRNKPEYKGVSGVIYMEIGSPRQFAYHLAKACGVPVEPNWYDTVVSKLFASMTTSLTLPSNDADALASVLPIIAEGGKKYKETHHRIAVLFIDGADILAKQKDRSLYINLVDWAKKCANEDSLQIVLVSSDSHVLALDQQSFKSRLADLIEVNDINRDQAAKLMENKYHFEKYFAELIYDRVGGRLTDIHKVVSLWRKKIEKKISREVVQAFHLPNQKLKDAIYAALMTANENGGEGAEDRSWELTNEERYLTLSIMLQYEWLKTCNSARIPIEVANAVNEIQGQPSNERLRGAVLTALNGSIQLPTVDRSDALKNGSNNCTIKALIHEWNWWNDFSGEIKRQFIREMKQAFCKVLRNDTGGWKLKIYIINSVLETKEVKTVEDIAIGYAKQQNSSIQEVIEAIQAFLENNVLRITKYRTLLCYNKMAEEVLRSFSIENETAETARHEKIETKGINGKTDGTERQDEVEENEKQDGQGAKKYKKQPEYGTDEFMVKMQNGAEENHLSNVDRAEL